MTPILLNNAQVEIFKTLVLALEINGNVPAEALKLPTSTFSVKMEILFKFHLGRNPQRRGEADKIYFNRHKSLLYRFVDSMEKKGVVGTASADNGKKYIWLTGKKVAAQPFTFRWPGTEEMVTL